MARKATHNDWLYLVWDPINNLIHGVHHELEAAEDQIRKLAAQAADHGPLHVVKAPGPTVEPEIVAADQSKTVRAQ